MRDQETFTFDLAYLKHQFKLTVIRYFMPFNPRFWRDFFACKGAKAKFNCWLEWPEHATTD